MRVLAAAVLATVLFGGGGTAPASALDGHWQPPDIGPAAVTLESVLSRAQSAAGRADAKYGQRVEYWTLRAGSATVPVVVTVRGDDVRFDESIDGATYSQGRTTGVRWRRTPNGIVRMIGVDVQGDDLDRWPLAYFPYSASDCRLLGETTKGPAAWVIEYRSAFDSPHWFYVDTASGRVVREIFREGSRNVTFDFSDFRNAAGLSRPFAWHISGAGGNADAGIDSVVPQSVAPSAIAIPASLDVPATLARPIVVMPAGFDRDRITVETVVNGHRASFILDTGTTQILIDDGSARRFGLKPTLGHAIVRELSTGGVTFANIAVQTVSLAGFGGDGILGYDYFRGHIVHIDYGRDRLELIAQSAFVPPADAHSIDANFFEAMPLVDAQFGSIATPRVVLDTGSSNVLLLRKLYSGGPNVLRQIGVSDLAQSHQTRFLEGAITAANAQIPNIYFAGIHFVENAVEIEQQETFDAVDFPIDAILGTNILTRFEWWYDDDDGRIWLRLT